MADVIDLSRIKPEPNLVSQFGQQAVAMLPPDMQDFDGILLSVADGYCFLFQYVVGQLAGALVCSVADGHELAGRLLAVEQFEEIEELELGGEG